MTDTAPVVIQRLERVFEAIHRERMQGLPILNPRLRVQAVGVDRWEEAWLGVLITPWAMNLIAIPLPTVTHSLGIVGSKRLRSFPSGDYEFISADAAADLGPHETCSLFSPMQEFADQAAAVATAEAVMKALFEPAAGKVAGESVAEGPTAKGSALRRPVTRRALLRSLGGLKDA